MKKGKIFSLIVAVLVLVIAGSVIYVLTNIDQIVKAAIEKYGSQATRTAVRVASVDIRLSAGNAAVKGLTVGNPAGYADQHIFSLDRIAVRIEPRSVTRTPIVLPEVSVAGPHVFYELQGSGVSNLDALMRNLKGQAKAVPRHGEGKDKKEIRLSIRKIVIEKGRVEARIAGLGEGPLVLDLPRLELHDVGGAEGATPEQIAATLANALAEGTANAVARSQGERYLRKGAESLLKRYGGE